MSKRLQEISRQALDYAFEICNQSGHTNLNSNVALTLAMSKQAELIVRECVNTLEFHGFDDAVPYIKWMATNKLGVEK